MTTAIGIARRPRAGVILALAAASLAGTVLPLSQSGASGAERSVHGTSHTVWLCRPGLKNDPCAITRTATSVDLHEVKSPFSTAATTHARTFDCFYVYPTVSDEVSLNSDLSVQKQETEIAGGQVSQFSSTCNVWAPMYKQGTNVALQEGEIYTQAVISTAYQSLLAAWKDYLAHDNHGRPVIFIGHSQGAALLIKLLRTQIDPSASMRHLLVSAIILGGNVQVAEGSDVGGSFRHIPTCSSPSETGCVIAYSTFPSEPGAHAVVGRPGQGVSILAGQTVRAGQQVACVDPVNFSSAVGDLVPLYPTVDHPVPGVTSPWSAFPHLYTAQCVSRGGASWLQIERTLPPSKDLRAVVTSAGPQWGYHLDDLNLALGNLILDVAYEEANYR